MTIKEANRLIDFDIMGFNCSKQLGLAWYWLLKMNSDRIKSSIKNIRANKLNRLSVNFNRNAIREALVSRKKILKRVLEG